VNKYEARIKATFYFKNKLVKALTLIDIIEAEGIVEACKLVDALMANLRCAFSSQEKRSPEYDELLSYREVDDIEVEVSAIVPANVK